MALELLMPVVAALAAQPTPLAVPKTQEPTVWIGVSLSESDERGLEITSVVADSPAARAGLRAGDRLLVAGDQRLASFAQLMEELSGREPGSMLDVLIARRFDVALDPELTADGGRPLLGVDLGGPNETQIAGLNRGYPAERAGLERGDVVVAIAGETVGSLEDIVAAMGALEGDEATTVVVRRELSVTLGRRPGASDAAPVPRFELPPPTSVEPPPGVEPPRMRGRTGRTVVPRGQRAAPDSDLHDELRELAADLRELRREIAELRQELESLRRRGR